MRPSPRQPRLQRPRRHLQRLRRRVHVHLMKVVEHHRLAIAHAAAPAPPAVPLRCDSAPRSRHAAAPCVAGSGASSIGSSPWESASARCGKRSPPRQTARWKNSLSRLHPLNPAPRPHQRFLRQLLRAAAVAAITPRHVYQWSLPAAHNPLERARIPGQHALHVGQVVIRIGCRFAHGGFTQSDRQSLLPVAFYSCPARVPCSPLPVPQLLQPQRRRSCRTGCKGTKRFPQQGGLQYDAPASQPFL